jgi:CTP:phosphocholine cytidylyltransferase-like protein
VAQEAEIKRITVGSQPGAISSGETYLKKKKKKKIHKKGLVEWLKGVSTKLKTQ